MRFKVIAVPQDQFDRYIDGWRQGANSQAAALVESGDIDALPSALNLCLSCHRVGGVPKTSSGTVLPDNPEQRGLQGGDADGVTFGPNLSMIACRSSIGAGILPNDEEHLRDWLYYPGGVKPGNYMATQIKEGTLTPEQIDQIVAYLKTLQPEGGCPEITGVNQDDVLRLADGVPVPAQASEPREVASAVRRGVGYAA